MQRQRGSDNSGRGQDGQDGQADTAHRRTEMFVIEKTTGQVKLVVDGTVTATVLDLAVNFASERGLLGIALHPRFPQRPYVYLYWTCRTAAPPVDPFRPDAEKCDDAALLGEDTNVILQVPLLGNRVDRFVWNGKTLTFDRNLISLRSFQSGRRAGAAEPERRRAESARQPQRRRHSLRSGRQALRRHGRRGTPRLAAEPGEGPTPPSADDQFGGPAAGRCASDRASCCG